MEHVEHSRDRDAYVAWQRQRLLAMLAETDVHPGEYELIVEKLRAGTSTRVLERYDESVEVLAELRGRGLRFGICSNWDWDLAEAVDEVGLTGMVDTVVSSAWVGARKPHPLIFEHTLAKLGGGARRDAVRRRHLGTRRRRPAQPRHDARCTSSATATGPTRPRPPDPAAEVACAADAGRAVRSARRTGAGSARPTDRTEAADGHRRHSRTREGSPRQLRLGTDPTARVARGAAAADAGDARTSRKPRCSAHSPPTSASPRSRPTPPTSGFVHGELDLALKHLGKWTKPQRVPTPDRS